VVGQQLHKVFQCKCAGGIEGGEETVVAGQVQYKIFQCMCVGGIEEGRQGSMW